MRKIVPFLLLALLAGACTTIDCPLNNTTYSKYDLCDATGKTDTLHDTLTVTTTRKSDGKDTVLLNRAVDITTFSLPMSYTGEEDVVTFTLKTREHTTLTDVVTIGKSNQSRFESTDCSPSYFHTISGINHTKNVIDSIVVTDPNVDNDANKTHFKIYFHPGH